MNSNDSLHIKLQNFWFSFWFCKSKTLWEVIPLFTPTTNKTRVYDYWQHLGCSCHGIRIAYQVTLQCENCISHLCMPLKFYTNKISFLTVQNEIFVNWFYISTYNPLPATIHYDLLSGQKGTHRNTLLSWCWAWSTWCSTSMLSCPVF